MSSFVITITNEELNVTVEANDVNLAYYKKELLEIVDNAVSNAKGK